MTTTLAAMGLQDEPPVGSLSPIPWGSRQMRRLGDSIRKGTPLNAGDPSYAELILWHNELAVCVQTAIRELDWESLLWGRAAPQITSRVKTLDTLREKLQRDHHRPLDGIQDIAGVRFEAEMTLEEQDVVAHAVAAAFDQDDSCVHDLRKEPHSGYRAVHVWLRLPQGRVEVQVRTHLQGAWANAYEALADVVGRQIRYDEPHPNAEIQELVTSLQELSLTTGVRLERDRQLAANSESALEYARGAPDASRGFLRELESMLRKQHDEARRVELEYTEMLRNLADQFSALRKRG